MTFSSVVICRNPFLRPSIRFKYICNHPRTSANSLFIYFWVISDSDRLGLLNSLLYVNLAPVSVMIPHTERAGSCSIWRQRLFNCTHSLVSRLNRRVHLMRNLRNELDFEKLHIHRMSATKYYFWNPKINPLLHKITPKDQRATEDSRYTESVVCYLRFFMITYSSLGFVLDKDLDC